MIKFEDLAVMVQSSSHDDLHGPCSELAAADIKLTAMMDQLECARQGKVISILIDI